MFGDTKSAGFTYGGIGEGWQQGIGNRACLQTLNISLVKAFNYIFNYFI